MKVISFVLLTIGFVFYAAGCKKPSTSCVSSGGGKGGAASISLTPTHQGFIDSCIIYIKYGTIEEPANGIYDDSQVCKIYPPDTIPVATFSGLKPGLYYFYGNGYHAGYYPPDVRGAAHYTVCNNNDTVSMYLPTNPYLP